MKKTVRPNYGLDAPELLRFFFVAGLIALAAMIAALFVFSQTYVWLNVIEAILGIIGVYLLGMGCLMVYDSKVTKIITRDRLLAMIPWCGDESVLDVGCGRGLMLVGAAQKLTTGKAFGIDIWQAKDQSANSPQGAIENAQLTNVGDRVEVKTADMLNLPFPDQSFDVVLSAWAVHNLEQKPDRDLALSEMMRVLKLGGHLILSDIAHRDVYAAYLKNLGLADTKIIFAPIRDQFLNIVSFGSYRPSAIVGRKPN
jgi:arsenite methyltransferase